MKNFIVLAVAALFATNAVAAEMKWSGSAGWRYMQQSQNDSLDSKDNATNNKDVSTTKTRAHQIRANIGVMGGWENVEWGFGLRSGGAGTTTSDYGNLDNGKDIGIAVEQVWARYVRDFGSLELAATVGRQKNALVSDTAWQTLFDKDARFDGFGWNFKFGMFGFNASQYVIGSTSRAVGVPATSGTAGASNYTYTESSESNATTTKLFSMLYGFQPHMTWKFSDEIEAMFAVAYYKWVHEGATNQIGGGAGVLGNGAGTVPALANRTLKMENKAQWDFLANVTLPFNMTFTGNLVKASKAAYSDIEVAGYTGPSYTPSNTAWTLGLTYGKLRKAQDFTVGYAYGTKGIASVMNAFTNDRFLADNKGHTIVAGYSLADNFHLGFRWMSLQEKERVDTTSATAAAGAGATYAGVNANQKMKTNFWELTAGVAF